MNDQANKGTSEELETISPDVIILNNEKESAFNWQSRRHPDWDETYLLYRDKVITNRLTQRQSVNLPLMKTAIKTALKDVDDPPMLYFEDQDNDKDAEIIYNEYFKYASDSNNLVIKDIVDKKQVFLYGRSFKKLNIVNGKFTFEILDPHDVLVDRFADPADLDSARYICHQHIFRPLSVIEQNENYDKEALGRLKAYMASNVGLVKADQNLQTVEARNQRMRDMGVPDVDNPMLGETYIELVEHYVMRINKETGEDERFIKVTAEGREMLMDKPLDKVIGSTVDDYWKKHTLLVSWADDVERTDIWSDGMGDTLRTPNKILNVWFSQLVENRTLRSFGMNFYDATKEADGFNPQTYTPIPNGWYGLPGKPSDVFQKVDIPDLSESIDEMEFLINLAEKASAATSIQQGSTEERRVTLGEVEIAMANATERIKSMSVFYTASWKEFGEKYVKLLEAAGDKLDDLTLYKKGVFTDKIYAKKASPSNWKAKAGWKVKVMSMSEKQDKEMMTLQKMNAIAKMIPDNKPLTEIYQKKLLEWGELSPDEIKEVMDYEKQKGQAPMLGPGTTEPAPEMTPPQMQPQMAPAVTSVNV